MSAGLRRLATHYLAEQRSTLWGRAFDLSQATSREEALDFVVALWQELDDRRRELTQVSHFDVV